MQSQVKVYPTKIFGDTVHISHDVPDSYIRAIVESKWQFIWGKETTVETAVSRTDCKVTTVPETALLNIFRFFVVTFCPDLSFGWLIPTMLRIETPQKIVTNKTIVNVIPLEEYNSEGQVRFLEYGSPEVLTQSRRGVR
jgi:hypothetical protein